MPVIERADSRIVEVEKTFVFRKHDKMILISESCFKVQRHLAKSLRVSGMRRSQYLAWYVWLDKIKLASE